MLMTLSACAEIYQAVTAPPAKEPGFYGVDHGWNGGSGEINGEVGHPLYVASPTAGCVNPGTGGAWGNWSSTSGIDQGTLPPGISMDGANIKGIPTERGHWIVTLRMSNITCNDKQYDQNAFTQQLIFHITGTGQVIN
jgi:hypothetical protein